MKKSKKIKVSDQEQRMIDEISKTFSSLGINSIQFGSRGKTYIDTKKKQMRKK